MPEMRVKSPRWARLVTAGGSLLLSLMIWLRMLSSGSVAGAGGIIALLVSVIIPVMAVDELQREYIFRPELIRKRSFFQWRDVPLTGLISFEVTSTRQIRILDAHSRERILEIPKEYWSDGKLLQDLKEFYRGHGRYHGEIDIPA